MKKAISVLLAVLFLASMLSGCKKKVEQPSGKIQTGKVDFYAFYLTYDGGRYNIFARKGPGEEQLKGDWIGSASPDGEVQVGVKADRSKGTYDVFECVGDDVTSQFFGWDLSTMLVFEYNDGGEDEGFCYWLAPEEVIMTPKEIETTFEEKVKEAAEKADKNEDLFNSLPPID